MREGSDRYAYVDNNPIHFNDPSGHCSGYNSTDGKISDACKAYWSAYNKLISQRFIDQRQSKYGVTLAGFTKSDQINVYEALDNLDKKLGGIAGFTAGKTYTWSQDPVYYGGETNPNGDIAFHSTVGGLPFQNIYHEVAHSMNFQTNNSYASTLNSNAVYAANGVFVMGGHSDNNYRRNSLGYTNPDEVFDPIGRDVEAQQHRGDYPCADVWCDNGNTAGEEWADLIANYVSGNFNSEPEGVARFNWIEGILH